ncbi:PilZ domain-containing protein [Candidatus Sumerlaeota bacterium]|nr:PilZ domain-containing protein [Candidatus Sumerlaeota bacterium]
MSNKPFGSRVHPRYKINLPIELQSVENIPRSNAAPSIHFRSTTQDISLGGVLVELERDAEGLDDSWKSDWFTDRFFWLRIKGIPRLKDGFFTKARVVRFMEKKDRKGPCIGLEYKDLIVSVSQELKDYLESLSRFE